MDTVVATIQVTLTLPEDLWTRFLALRPGLTVADAVCGALQGAIDATTPPAVPAPEPTEAADAS